MVKLRQAFSGLLVLGLASATLTALVPTSPLDRLVKPEKERVVSATAKEPNSKVVIDQNGQRFMEMRWVPGGVGRVGRLRVPLGYIWAGGGGLSAALGPDYPDPNVVGPYLTSFILEALLPDFAPRTIANSERFKDGISGETIRISTTVSRPFNQEGEPIIDWLFRSRASLLHTPYSERTFKTRFGPKPDRFGLKRLGPTGDFEQFREFGFLEEIYFLDQEPKEMFIVCAAEEIFDVVENINWNRRPICEHKYYSYQFKAIVTLVYRRTKLEDWRILEEKTEKFLQDLNFIEGN